MNKILRLPVKSLYFNQIKNLEKPEEYRLTTEYWIKRLVGKSFDEIHITLGYPKNDDKHKIIKRPWRGYTEKWITHEHFGSDEVRVFAIIVN